MDKSTVLGFFGGFLLVSIGILLGGPLTAFWDLPSVCIVFGGGALAANVAYPIANNVLAYKLVWACFMVPPEFDNLKIIKQLVEIADMARKEGILSIESKIPELENKFMAKALDMVIANADIKLVEDTLDNEIYSTKDRHDGARKVLEFQGSVVPAFGMIGTLIGLVQMLRNLDNPSTIGPSMAVAMITTFYGAMAANLFFTPLAKKLEYRSGEELLYLQIIAKGCLMIAGGINPKLIEDNLLTYLSGSERQAYALLGTATEQK